MIRPKGEPPKFAIWILRHMVSSERCEPLVGDLVEKFHRRRSPHWFWREVLIVMMLSIGEKLRSHSGEITFAVFGTTLQELWWRTPWWGTAWQSHTFQSVYGWGVGWPFPLSIVYDLVFYSTIRIAILVLLAAIFFSAKGGRNWRNDWKHILISFTLLAAGRFIFFLFPRTYYVVSPGLFFFAFLISTWTLFPPKTPRSATF